MPPSPFLSDDPHCLAGPQGLLWAARVRSAGLSIHLNGGALDEEAGRFYRRRWTEASGQAGWVEMSMD